jgi:hypothetical protein
MNVYELTREKDDEGYDCYQQLVLTDLETHKKLKENEAHLGWFDNRQLIGDAWFPVNIVANKDGYSQVPGDYPLVHGCSSFFVTPIFSQRAVDTLADLLEGNGELLPLICEFGQYYVFNITREVDALDEARSELKLNSELYPYETPTEPDFYLVTRFAFHPDRVADLSIFKLPKRNRKNRPLVTERFVQRVQDSDLKGMAFNLLWSSSSQPTATVI